MASNFTLCLPVEKSTINSPQPVLAGNYLETKDQAPSGAWLEVAFAEIANLAGKGLRGALVHISTDANLRYAVAAAAPAGGYAGAQILAGVERTIGVPAELKLWIK